MAKKLILVRHSDAESGSFSSPDIKRRLTPEGKNKANMQARRLLKKNLLPDLIITSTASRALETTEIFSNVLKFNCSVLQMSFLYEDFTTSDFFALLNEISDSIKTVVIIGHNPTISVMASRLDLDAMVSFNPCSVGIFDINTSWNSVLVGDAKLAEFFNG